MSLIYSPKIVTDGLVLALDAADSNSYPGTGATWYDLSGNNFHHTLVNTPLHAGKNGFVFDETQGVTFSSAITTSGTCTVVMFVKTSDTIYLWVRGQGAGTYYLSADNNGGGYYHSNCGNPINYVDTNVSTLQPHDNQWHMLEAKNVDFSTWTQFGWFSYGGSWNLIGNCGLILVYDKYLTPAESKQNFNTLKTRFGL